MTPTEDTGPWFPSEKVFPTPSGKFPSLSGSLGGPIKHLIPKRLRAVETVYTILPSRKSRIPHKITPNFQISFNINPQIFKFSSNNSYDIQFFNKKSNFSNFLQQKPTIFPRFSLRKTICSRDPTDNRSTLSGLWVTPPPHHPRRVAWSTFGDTLAPPLIAALL